MNININLTNVVFVLKSHLNQLTNYLNATEMCDTVHRVKLWSVFFADLLHKDKSKVP